MVGVDGRLVYESLVCPDNEIIDYNTRYSGISAKDFGKLLQQENNHKIFATMTLFMDQW